MKTLLARVWAWFEIKTVCAWHKPKPIRLRGWPWARKVSHGMCDRCFRREMKRELTAMEGKP
jgi:hypothetical protein